MNFLPTIAAIVNVTAAPLDTSGRLIRKYDAQYKKGEWRTGSSYGSVTDTLATSPITFEG